MVAKVSEPIPKRLSEFIPPSKDLEGFIEISEVLGKELIITSYELREGDFGTYAVVWFKTSTEGIDMCFTTGGKVVLKKLELLAKANAFPVLATVVRQKRYYDLV